MRYYLDTNMLVFILQKNKDNINRKVVEILKDSSLFFMRVLLLLMN